MATPRETVYVSPNQVYNMSKILFAAPGGANAGMSHFGDSELLLGKADNDTAGRRGRGWAKRAAKAAAAAAKAAKASPSPRRGSMEPLARAVASCAMTARTSACLAAY